MIYIYICIIKILKLRLTVKTGLKTFNLIIKTYAVALEKNLKLKNITLLFLLDKTLHLVIICKVYV